MQRLPLLFLLQISIFFSLQASFKKEDEWVTIMEITKEGVIIASDPESAGELPTIEASYYPLRPKKKSFVLANTHAYTITTFIKKQKFTELIRENYIDEHSLEKNINNNCDNVNAFLNLPN